MVLKGMEEHKNLSHAQKEKEKKLKVWWHTCFHSFYLFLHLPSMHIIFFIYNTRRVPLFISSLLPLGRGPPLGCRAEIRTRACHRVSQRATD
jgi:hypothetical protein